MDPDKLKKSTTTDGKEPTPGYENQGAPAPINPVTGQHERYWVLDAMERAKGFVRPVRRTYVHSHVPKPTHPLRDLTPDELARYAKDGYVKYEEYPDEGSVLGQYWTQAKLDRAERGCGVATTMGDALAETYARDPKYYGATFCVGCKQHFPVAEFTWDMTDEIVGS